jgi:glycosyl transferase, family 51 (fragment)
MIEAKHMHDIIRIVKRKTSISSTEKKSPSKRMNIYANLAQKHRTKKDKEARERAEYLATLPKHPVKRFFYRLHPKRLAKYWFSKRGGLMALKILGVSILLMLLLIGGLFAYFRKDLDKIRPGELAKRVQTTVTKYYDRNDNLLWEDKGTGNYQLVVEANQISDYLKKATVAIEDRDFYNHHGISVSGMARALLSTASRRQVQGGSTLTQQLVKQVFFADEAGDRSISGIPRKIKEIILAIEVERMYSKDQILSLYLNESPYGGRRNGAESASQTYFGKHAKDLTLAEAALIASIPQNPTYYNPYNTAGNKALITRQHTTLDYMAEQGVISKAEAEKAKKVDILSTIKPQTEQLENIKAPHFLLMVRNQLSKELGESVVGRGGLTIKTTLDWRIQEKLETEMKAFFATGRPDAVRISNGAATIEDTQTGQIVALVGSRDFNHAGYGQDNAAVSYIQPGSTIKSLVFAQLFDKHDNKQAYGSGTVLSDDNIDSLYGAKLRNWDGKFMGGINIRKALSFSRNIPAVKAAYIIGNGSAKPVVEGIRNMGNTNYCRQEENAGGYGLGASIGACGTKQTELVNAYGTLARMGVQKDSSSVIEVKNSQGETLKKWKDDGKRVIDPQSAYIVNDILSDRTTGLHGWMGVNGVRTSAKTGTSDKGSQPKDLWIVNYSPALVMGIWLGNSDTSVIGTSASNYAMPVVRSVMSFAHTQVYAKEGKWKSGQWYDRPNGVQTVDGELYPSWWNKKQSQSSEKITFDKVSKKKATNCTPDGAKEELEVTKIIDPLTKKESIKAPDGYDANAEDDTHKCEDVKPQIGAVSVSNSGKKYTISVDVSAGTWEVAAIEITVDGKSVKSSEINTGGKQTATVEISSAGTHTVSVTVRDRAYYTATSNSSFTSSSSD